MTAVIIPASIRDPALRRTLQQLCIEVDQSSDNGASVEVQTDDPTDNTPGEVGDIIYASGTESIWIFTATSWTRASSGAEGITVALFASQAAEGVTADWENLSNIRDTSPNFKNDNQRIIGVYPRVYVGGVEWEASDYNSTDTSFNWRKNGLNFTPSAEQIDGVTGTNNRVLLINQDDVRDGNINEVFTISINFDP